MIVAVRSNPFAGYYPTVGELPVAPHLHRFAWRPWWWDMGGGVFRHCAALATVCRSDGGYLVRRHDAATGRDVEVLRLNAAAGMAAESDALTRGLPPMDEVLALADVALDIPPTGLSCMGQITGRFHTIAGLPDPVLISSDRGEVPPADVILFGPGAPWMLPGLRFRLIS